MLTSTYAVYSRESRKAHRRSAQYLHICIPMLAMLGVAEAAIAQASPAPAKATPPSIQFLALNKPFPHRR